jgi:predicted DNA-binding protein YlxM (UPF0122 family)
MNRKIYLNSLYDCYKELFTEKQKMYFELYYWDDLSLAEIAENNNISRNAVHNQLKKIEEKMLELEEQLKLFEKKEKILSLLNNKIEEDLFEKVKGIL